jgi:hypothetical protein
MNSNPFPRVRTLMRSRGTRLYHLAELLRMSDSAICERLHGRAEFAPHEKARLAWYFSVKEEWLFAPEEIPASARIQPTPFAPARWAR